VNGLDAASRDALEQAILKARQLLEEDLAETAEGRLGIYADGTIDSEDALRLPPGALGERREVVEVLTHLRREGETAEGAVGRLIREAAFTHLNRLVAIRVAEAIELLPPSLAQGRISQGFRDLLEVAPLLAADATGGYWTYLQLCGDELAADDPVLFDPRNPLLALAPSPAALDQLIEVLANPKLAAAWTAPDTFGWAYQFFNTGEERRQMRDKSSAPRTSRELAVRNQFFTPRYVVDFLVQNSLGRRLLEADPDSGLVDKLPLLVDPPSTRGQPLPLDEVRVLDPACGSGHFLLGCYDLLELAWQHVGVKPAEAAARILPSLWGIDIDPRCAQVASAAVMLRARRACRDGNLPRPNVLTARALPEDPEAWKQALAGLSFTHRKLVASLRDALIQAPVLGPLLKVEERLAADLHRSVPEAGDKDTLFGATGMADTAIDRAETEVLAAVQRAADEASSTAAERLLAAESIDAIRFVEAMRQRYDAVLMNPPFGEPVPSTKPYLRAAYEESPAELYACFVRRGLELTKQGGLVGAITNRTGFFLSSLGDWRRGLIRDGITCFADLGSFVLEGAQVEVAAYVVGRQSHNTTFLRCLTVGDKAAALARRPAHLKYEVDPAAFTAVPQTCFAYWIGDEFLDLFRRCEPFESGDRTVSRGLSAGDNFRFVRLRWEVRPGDIASRSWVNLSKGGEYSPFFDDVHLVLDWRDSDRPYREVDGARIFNLSLQGRPGVCWPKRTTSLPSGRPLPKGSFFEANSIPAFGPDPELILGWVNSRVFALCFLAQVGAGDTARGSAAKDWITGPARQLPWITPSDEQRHSLRDLARDAALAARELMVSSETAAHFVAPDVFRVDLTAVAEHFEAAIRAVVEHGEGMETRMLEVKHALDMGWLGAYGLGQQALSTLDFELEPSPAGYPSDSPRNDELFGEAYLSKDALSLDSASSDKLDDSRTKARLKSQVELRSIEDLCHIFSASPQAIVAKRRELNLIRSEDLLAGAQDILSYLVGCAFGRWDVRIGRDPSLAPPQPGLFDPVPLCPPGMLVGDDGLPAWNAPPDYPLALPPDQVLVDEPGHQWDIEAAMRRAATALLDDPEGFLAEVEGTLRHRSLRDYLRKQFFRDHLGRYSKSRRKAPIYWHLSVPSREWGVWVYAPSLARETLYAVASHAARRLAAGRERVAALRAEREAGGRGRSASEVGRHLEAEEELVNALQAFRAEAERVAGLGWEPDLDDGIILCAAPLAGLFPAWRQAAEERAKLREGAYPWASVSRWREVL